MRPMRWRGPERLADHVAEHDPQRYRRGDGVPEQLHRRCGCRRSRGRRRARSRSSSRDEAVLKPLVCGDRGCHAPPRAERPSSGVGWFAKGAGQLRHPFELDARRRVSGDQEPDREPRDDRLDPRLVEGYPEGDPEDYGYLVSARYPARTEVPRSSARRRQRGPGESPRCCPYRRWRSPTARRDRRPPPG